MTLITTILTGAAQLAMSLFLFFCLVALAVGLRDAARGKLAAWVRREAIIGVRAEMRAADVAGRRFP